MIKVLQLKDIKNSEFNPRVPLEKGSKEYRDLQKSIQEHTLVEPLVVNEYNMCCIGGHQRLAVMRDMGMTEAICSVIHEEDPLREKALCVALNKIKGRFDEEKLNELLFDNDVSKYTTGFEFDEAMTESFIDAAEDVTENLEELTEDREIETVVKLGSIKFKITETEYNNLIASIRDEGFF